MIFHDTRIAGAYWIEPERAVDERGFFARTWCRQEFAERGLDTMLVQCSISFSRNRGTLRGMHYQQAPHDETKLVRCTRGSIYDVILDLRPESPTFTHWQAFELTSECRRELHVPKGVAHGFLTLCDDCEILYQVSTAYCAAASRGVRWDDPAFGIEWPDEPHLVSDRDRSFPLWNAAVAAGAAGGPT